MHCFVSVNDLRSLCTVCGHRSGAQNTDDASDIRQAVEGAAVLHPWVAGLLRETKPACTATVITTNKLLTAAHCVTR